MEDEDEMDAGDFEVVCGDCGTEVIAGDCIDESGEKLQCPECGSNDMNG